jgi:hypothetical protein
LPPPRQRKSSVDLFGVAWQLGATLFFVVLNVEIDFLIA